VSNSGLVTIVGGKWTTYRKMAEDALSDAIAVGCLSPRASVTETLALHGYMDREDPRLPVDCARRVYGSDLPEVDAIAAANPALAAPLHARLPYTGAQVVYGARREMARTVEDVLARRTRALLLDARAAIEAAPRVANLLGAELGRDASWASQQVGAFRALARGYLLDG
jgi:glycerol-3-phosphate dehydrogenase